MKATVFYHKKKLEAGDFPDCNWTIETRPHCAGSDEDMWQIYIAPGLKGKLFVFWASCQLCRLKWLDRLEIARDHIYDLPERLFGEVK